MDDLVELIVEEYTFNRMQDLNDKIEFENYESFKAFNIECLNEMTPEKIAWLRTLTRMIKNNSLRMVDEECCGEWDAYAFYFNNKKILCLVHPR